MLVVIIIISSIFYTGNTNKNFNDVLVYVKEVGFIIMILFLLTLWQNPLQVGLCKSLLYFIIPYMMFTSLLWTHFNACLFVLPYFTFFGSINKILGLLSSQKKYKKLKIS